MLSSEAISDSRKIFNETDKRITEAFKVLSDLNRYRIFRLLAQQPELSISSIALVLNISLPLTSQHVKILTLTNLLHKERLGKKVFTKLETQNHIVPTIVQTIQQIIKLETMNLN